DSTEAPARLQVESPTRMAEALERGTITSCGKTREAPQYQLVNIRESPTVFTGPECCPPPSPPPGKRLRRLTLCQTLYRCEVLPAADHKADSRARNSSARPRSGADEELLVSCHSTRRALPGNTTSRGRARWAGWFPRRAPSGPDPRLAATAGKTPADRGDSAARSACASRPRALPQSSPRAEGWMA